MPLKNKQDLEEFSVCGSTKILSNEQGYILTRSMFDVFFISWVQRQLRSHKSNLCCLQLVAKRRR